VVGGLATRGAVYRVVAEPRVVHDAASYYSRAAYDALPDDHGKRGVVVLGGDCYTATIRAALSSVARPPDVTPGGGHAVCVGHQRPSRAGRRTTPMRH
jgi:hypothetical protein